MQQLLGACFKAECSPVELFFNNEALFRPRVSETCQVYAGNRSLERKVASIRTSHFLLEKVTCSKSVKKLGRCQIKSGFPPPGERHGPNLSQGPSVFLSCHVKQTKLSCQKHLTLCVHG
jgi:hypothetical protein